VDEKTTLRRRREDVGVRREDVGGKGEEGG